MLKYQVKMQDVNSSDLKDTGIASLRHLYEIASCNFHHLFSKVCLTCCM